MDHDRCDGAFLFVFPGAHTGRKYTPCNGVCVLQRGLEPACCSVDGQDEQMPDHPTIVVGNSDFGKKYAF